MSKLDNNYELGLGFVLLLRKIHPEASPTAMQQLNNENHQKRRTDDQR